MGYRYRGPRIYPPPAIRSGNLYYVRLKTPMGLMYKLGFTTLGSVHDRLAYQASGDEKYIDSVLCFVHLDDAWGAEQRLHQHFVQDVLFYKGGVADMPLFGNGQGELYRDDILGFDEDFTKEQSHGTRVNLWVNRHKKSGASDEEAEEMRRVWEDQFKSQTTWTGRAPSDPPTRTVRVVKYVAGALFGFIYRLLYPDHAASSARVQDLIKQIREAKETRSYTSEEILAIKNRARAIVARARATIAAQSPIATPIPPRDRSDGGTASAP